MALFEPGLHFVLEIMALRHTSSSHAGVIAAIFSLLTALGGASFFREALDAHVGAMGMTLAGVVLAEGGKRATRETE